MGIFILFILYSVCTCRMIIKRKHANGKGSKFLTGAGVVIVNGLFFIATFTLFNDVVTIATGETYQATVTGIAEHTTRNSGRQSHSRSTVYSPILHFQTKDEGLLERTSSTYTNEEPVIGESIEIRYSSFNKSIFVNSLGEYALLCVTVLGFIVLFLLEWIFLSYALRGTIPVFLEPFFRKFRKNLFILILIAVTLGMSVTLCIMMIQSIFINTHTQLSAFAIIMCCFFAAVTGAIGTMLIWSLMKKKVSR